MRTSRARTPFHSLRAAMVATTMVTLAAAAHVIAGGQLPAPAILAAVLALTGLTSTAATRLKLNLPAMAALLGAGQVILHEAFAAFSTPAAADAGPGGTASDAGAASSAGLAGAAATAAHHTGFVQLPHPAGHLQLHELDSVASWSMLAGHALATLACALLLAKGEDALWSLAAWLRPLIELPAPAPLRPAVARAVPPHPRAAVPLPWRNLRADCRRGPPAVVVPS